MKKKLFILISILLLFTGCSVVEEYSRGSIEKEASISKKEQDESPSVEDENETKPKTESSVEVKTEVDENKNDKKDEKIVEEKTEKAEDKSVFKADEKVLEEKIEKKEDKNLEPKEESKKDKIEVTTKKELDKKAEDLKKSEEIKTSENTSPKEEKEVKTTDIIDKEEQTFSVEKRTVDENIVNTNLSNNKNGWWFSPKKGNALKSTIPQNISNLLNKYSGIWQANTNEKVLYLTFDEGYEYNNNTTRILDILKSKGVKATFFITGAYINSNLNLVKRMINEGHTVGNHTNNHLNQVNAITTPQKLIDDILSLENMYEEKTGNKMSNFMRPPEGVYSERTLDLSKKLGYRPVFWSFAYRDWETKNQPDKNAAIEKIVSQFHPGSVMLLHAVSNTNTEILGEIIDKAVKAGYRFGNLNEI